MVDALQSTMCGDPDKIPELGIMRDYFGTGSGNIRAVTRRVISNLTRVNAPMIVVVVTQVVAAS